MSPRLISLPLAADNDIISGAAATRAEWGAPLTGDKRRREVVVVVVLQCNDTNQWRHVSRRGRRKERKTLKQN